MSSALLTISGLTAGYGDQQVLFGFDLTVGAGEVASLLGRNGMGKTTAVRALMGLLPISGGRVSFDGRSIAGSPPFRIAQAGIGLVPEGRQIFPTLTVEENLVATAARGSRQRWTLERVYAFMPRLAERRDHFGDQISGGEQQMLAIGRAMMLEPKIILLDEPTEGLMPRMVSQIREIIEVLHRDGVAILLVEQNVPLTLAASQRVYFMEKGAVQHHAAASDLTVDHPIIHKYLGV